MFKNNNCITNRYHRLYSNKYLYGFLSNFVILQPCSQDQNCDILSQRYKVHITISASALACLVNNHAPNYDREWEIPFTVRDYQLQGVYSHPFNYTREWFYWCSTFSRHVCLLPYADLFINTTVWFDNIWRTNCPFWLKIFQ